MEINTLTGLAIPPITPSPVKPPQEEHTATVAPQTPPRLRKINDPVSGPLQFPKNTRLRVDEASNRIVAQILDENNELVRQLPPQELLDIAARFNRLEGILFDERR